MRESDFKRWHNTYRVVKVHWYLETKCKVKGTFSLKGLLNSGIP